MLDLILPDATDAPAGYDFNRRLCDEAHLHVFALWYEMGGKEQPLTPIEAAKMPAAMSKDFRTLLKWVDLLKFENGITEDADNEGAGGIKGSLRAAGYRESGDGFLVKSVSPFSE